MNRTKRLRGPCEHCGGPIEYPAQLVGTKAQCPHCQKTTDLVLGEPKIESGIPPRIIVWTVITVLILLAGLAGALYALRKAQSFVQEQKAVPAATNAPAQP